MTRPSPRAMRHTVAALLSLLIAAPTAAQNQATPAQTPTPTPLQRLNGYSLPPSSGARPTPTPGATPVPVPAPPVLALPTVQSTPTPAPTTTATPVVRTEPRRSLAPSAAQSPTRTPAPTPAAPADPAVERARASVVPETTVAVTPTPVATPAPQPDLAASDQGSAWRWWLAALIIAALAIAAIVVGRRRRAATLIEGEPSVSPEPAPALVPVATPAPIAPTPLPPAVAPVGPATRASPAIDMVLRPGRAGLNLLSALVEGELVVTNQGTEAIEQIQIGVGLLSAHRGQDADLAAFFAAPPGRPAVPAFSLAPGESRAVRVVAATSRTAVEVMHAGNRPIFVPIVACLCRFVTQGDPYRAARAFAVGIERGDSAKLAPFWLDVPARMYDTVTARPHALPAGVV